MTRKAALAHEKKSPEHLQNLHNTEMWWDPKPDIEAWLSPAQPTVQTTREIKYQEHCFWVDNVGEFVRHLIAVNQWSSHNIFNKVPFWIKGVEAAERGEPWKLETFLETRPDMHAAPSPSFAASDKGWSNKGSGNEDWGWLQREQNENVEKEEEDNGWGPTSKDTCWDDPECETEQPKNNWTRDSKTGEPAYEFVEDIARQTAADTAKKRQMHFFFQVRYNPFLLVPLITLPTDAYRRKTE